MTDYNDGNWHGWNGGECPLHPETKGEFVFADGCICSRKPAGEWQWDDKHLPLIAFRVTEEYKEPREFWAFTHASGHIEAFPYEIECTACARAVGREITVRRYREVLE